MTFSSQLVLIFIVSIALLGLSCGGPNWITDAKSGCAIINPHPIPNETITYDGECVQGKAEGFGRLSWYEDSVLTSTYEGNMNSDSRMAHSLIHSTTIHVSRDKIESSSHRSFEQV